MNAGKREILMCAKPDKQKEVPVTDIHGTELKQVSVFKYLGSKMCAAGGWEIEIKERLKAGWQK
jgi:hypothetical protein